LIARVKQRNEEMKMWLWEGAGGGLPKLNEGGRFNGRKSVKERSRNRGNTQNRKTLGRKRGERNIRTASGGSQKKETKKQFQKSIQGGGGSSGADRKERREGGCGGGGRNQNEK